MREIVGRDHPPNPAIYWADFLASTAVAYAAAAIFLLGPRWGIPGGVMWAAGVVSGFALFRVGTFMHEVHHLRRGEVRGFSLAWNVLYGVPFLMPSFMYDHHGDHHSLRKYGTREDGEYLPLGRGPLWRLMAYLVEIPALPVLAVLRFGLAVPLSFANRRWRRWLIERASSYGINLANRRRVPDSALYGESALADLGGFLVVALVAVLLGSGVLPWEWLGRLYLLAVVALGLNWVRTLFAHRYLRDGSPGTRLDQLRDSITISGHPWLTELLFPVGLRYHSLHHLFPTIPYHDLGRAHRALCASLPADSLYRLSVYPSTWAAWRSFWTGLRGGALQSARS